jgi:hypothetical protein
MLIYLVEKEAHSSNPIFIESLPKAPKYEILYIGNFFRGTGDLTGCDYINDSPVGRSYLMRGINPNSLIEERSYLVGSNHAGSSNKDGYLRMELNTEFSDKESS